MKKFDIDKATYIADENGEIIKELSDSESLAILNVGDRILRRGKIEDLKKLVPIKMRFGKINMRAFGMICRKYPIFANMIEYVGYQTGKLSYRNGVLINRTNLAKACGVSSATVDRQIKGLIKDDVIKIVKDGRNSVFYVNPYIIHIGKCVYQSLVDMFRDTIYKKNYEKTLEGENSNE